MTPLRVAAIGTSSITKRTILAAAPVEGLRFTHLVSRDAGRAASLANDLASDPDAAASGLVGTTLEDALASDDIDAMYVASPNAVHRDQVAAALAAGKHVLCEKPATLTADEFSSLCEDAERAGLVLLENMRSAHDPLMLRAVELLPTLGPIRHVSLSFCQRSGRYDDLLAGREVRIFDPALGGGALNDLGVYVAHPLVRLFGAPDAVTAAFVDVSTGADGSGAALARYPGFVAQLAWSKTSQGLAGSEIGGEGGTLWLDHIADLHRLRVRYTDGHELDESPAKESDNITYTLRRFAELVATGDSARAEQGWTRDALAVMEQARASRR